MAAVVNPPHTKVCPRTDPSFVAASSSRRLDVFFRVGPPPRVQRRIWPLGGAAQINVNAVNRDLKNVWTL